MAITDKGIIKNWFRNGLKPVQEQFWAWMDSYRHKSEKIPLADVDGIDDALASKASSATLNGHITGSDAHAALFLGKEDKNQKGQANGYVPLNEVTKIASQYLNIIDDVVSGGSDALLSAEQGKVLQGRIDAINFLLTSDNVNLDSLQELVDAIETLQTSLSTILVNDLTTGGVTKALTAEMGKSLKALIDGLNTNKVDKVAGERLITAAEQTKLAGLGSVVTTVKTILSTALATQNVAGFVTYINALNPVLAVGANETVTYKTSDTGRVFELLLRGRSFGTGQAAIVAADVLEVTEFLNKDITLSNYPSTRNDGALPTNKILAPDTNGNLKLYSMPILPAPFILELIPDSHLPSSTGNIELLGEFFIPSMCFSTNLNNSNGIQIVGQTINYAVFVNSQKILMNVTTGAAQGSFSIVCNNGIPTTKTGALLIVYGAVYSPLTADWSSVSNLVIENDSVDLSIINVQGSATWNREFDFNKDWRLIFNASLSPLGAANLDRNAYQQTRLELIKVSDSSVVFGYQIYQQVAGPGTMNHNGYTAANGWGTVSIGGSIGLDTDLNAWERLKGDKQYSLDYLGGVLYEKINGTVLKTHTDVLTENLKLRLKPKNFKFENVKYIELT